MVTGELNWQALARLDAQALLLSFGLLGLNYLLGGGRLYWLAKLADAPLTLAKGVRAYLLGLVAAAVTPGGSGNTPAVGVSLQKSGLAAVEAWSVTLYIAVLDLFFIAWSVPLSLALLGVKTQLLEPRSATVLAVAVFIVGLGLWFVLSYRLAWLEFLTRWLFGLKWLKRWQERALDFHGELERATTLMARRPLWLHVSLAVMTALQHTTNYLIFYVIAAALGDIAFWSSLAAVHASTLASYIVPVPGGSGFLEVAVTTLVGSNIAVPAVVAWRLITFYTRFLIAPFVGGSLALSELSSGEKETEREGYS